MVSRRRPSDCSRPFCAAPRVIRPRSKNCSTLFSAPATTAAPPNWLRSSNRFIPRQATSAAPSALRNCAAASSAPPDSRTRTWLAPQPRRRRPLPPRRPPPISRPKRPFRRSPPCPRIQSLLRPPRTRRPHPGLPNLNLSRQKSTIGGGKQKFRKWTCATSGPRCLKKRLPNQPRPHPPRRHLRKPRPRRWRKLPPLPNIRPSRRMSKSLRSATSPRRLPQRMRLLERLRQFHSKNARPTLPLANPRKSPRKKLRRSRLSRNSNWNRSTTSCSSRNRWYPPAIRSLRSRPHRTRQRHPQPPALSNLIRYWLSLRGKSISLGWTLLRRPSPIRNPGLRLLRRQSQRLRPPLRKPPSLARSRKSSKSFAQNLAK